MSNSCRGNGPSMTMASMAKRSRLNFAIQPGDVLAIAALMKLVPNATGEVPESKVLRACLRLGMHELLKDPTRNLDAIAPPVVDPDPTPRIVDRGDRSEAETVVDNTPPARRPKSGNTTERKPVRG